VFVEGGGVKVSRYVGLCVCVCVCGSGVHTWKD